jgi:hypothetical protein
MLVLLWIACGIAAAGFLNAHLRAEFAGATALLGIGGWTSSLRSECRCLLAHSLLSYLTL